MRIVKHVHACIEIEAPLGSVVIDPGAFDPGMPALLARADAVLITHAHADHVVPTAVAAELARRPSLAVRAPAAVVDGLAGDDVVAVTPGDAFAVAGLDVSVHGGLHAQVYPRLEPDPNVGYLIGGTVYHPGDSYEAPGALVDVLLVPVSGPWTTFAGALAFVEQVAPQRAIAIHDAPLSEIGLGMVRRHLGAGGFSPVPVEMPAPGEAFEA